MLNASDPRTITSLRLLKHTIENSPRPIVFWIGAGASRWLGFPSWEELARLMRRRFFELRIPGFPNEKATELIQGRRLPAFFQLCKSLNSAQYYRFLAQSFAPRASTTEYDRFIVLLNRLAPTYVVTTNVDESLENRINQTSVLQRSDITRSLDLLIEGSSFLAKLHGTVSAIETVVFTDDEYRQLVGEASYVQVLKHLFAASTVVFLGYGVADDYVLRLLVENDNEMRLFGSGPHFVVTAAEQTTIAGVNRIAYETKRYQDHRSAMTILDFIWQSKRLIEDRGALVSVSEGARAPAGRQTSGPTGYFISDFGTRDFFTTAIAERSEEAMTIEVSIGLGFSKEEWPQTKDGIAVGDSSVHDLIVGLICFDTVYIPLSALGKAHQLIPHDRLWRLVESHSLHFIHIEHLPAVVRSPAGLFGEVGLLRIQSRDNAIPRTISEVIRSQVTAVHGKEAEAEKLFAEEEKQTVAFQDAERLEIASLVKNALLMPDIARLLGISDAILPT